MKNQPKPRAKHVHNIMTEKAKSGAAGTHTPVKSKTGLKKQLKQLDRIGYFK